MKKGVISFSKLVERVQGLRLSFSVFLLVGVAISIMVPRIGCAQTGWVTLYQNNFQTGDLSNWQLDPGWIIAQQNTNKFLSGSGHSWATYTKGIYLTNYRLGLRVKLVRQGVHLNVRLSNTGRYYIGMHENGIYLNKQFFPSTFIELTKADFPITKNTWHNVSVTVAGNRIKVAVDGVEKINYLDGESPLPSGTFAMETIGDQDALVYFDDIKVVGEIPPPRISWFSLQHRVYEDGRDFNRISFEIKYGMDQYVTTDRLNSIKLTDPNGDVVAVTRDELNLAFSAYNYLEGAYDGNNGVFLLYGAPNRSSSYAGVVPGKLIAGTYHLSVQYANSVSNMDFTFNGLVDLPIIPGTSIRSSMDTSGNLTATWAVPMSLCKTRPTLQTSVRAFIDVYQDQDPTPRAELYIGIPTHMGRWFVPKAVVDWLKSQGNKYTIGVQLRTNDNCNRAYSNTKSISLSSTGQDMSMDGQEFPGGGEM